MMWQPLRTRSCRRILAPRKYAVTSGEDESEVVPDKNYIGWLVSSDVNALKQQQFLNRDGQQLPNPTALLYRMLPVLCCCLSLTQR